VFVGNDFSCALLADSTVKCWGLNTKSQTGQVYNAYVTSPNTILGIPNIP